MSDANTFLDLSNLLENYSLFITYTLLTSIIILKWLKGLGMLHGGLLFYHFIYPKKNDFHKTLYFFLAASFILVCVNLFNNYVLTNRYWGYHWWWVFILIAPVILNLIELKKTHHLTKYSLGIFILLLIINSLIDKSDNLEQEVAEYIRNNNLTEINFGDNHRIQYYVNYQFTDLMKQSILKKFKYKLIHGHLENNYDEAFVIKNFPEKKPKFTLIKND